MNLPGMPHLGTYRLILADPPWEHENFGQAKHGAAKAIYSEMPLASLKEMPVGALAHPEGALLLLWSTACQVAEGAHVELARAWGFELRTRALSWVKLARACAFCEHTWDEHQHPGVVDDVPWACLACTNSTGVSRCVRFAIRSHRGPGSYTMQGVEDLFLGVRGGGFSALRSERDVPEILFAPRAEEHSVKPDRAQDRLERLWPELTPRLELFARRRRAGWAAWGNEAPDCDLVFGKEVGNTWSVLAPAAIAEIASGV